MVNARHHRDGPPKTGFMIKKLTWVQGSETEGLCVGTVTRLEHGKQMVSIIQNALILSKELVNQDIIYIGECIEGTIERLGSAPDLYYLHRIDPNTPLEESIPVLDELGRTGKMKYIGLSECSAATLRKAHSIARIDAVQAEYSAFETLHGADGLIDATRELSVAYVAYGPLGHGWLVDDFAYNSPDHFAPTDGRHSITVTIHHMALLQLPSELVGHILADVGSEFFYQDTRRLTVSRRWYGLALPILTRDLEFACVSSLEEFLINKNAVAQAENYLRSVTLGLDIFYDELVSRRLEPYKDYDTLEAQWRDDINDRLASLAVALNRCSRLGILSVIAPVGIRGLVALSLAPEPFIGLLSAGNLTSLVFDIAGDHSFRARECDEPHLCRHINALLPSLRRLRCRMFWICGSILRPLPDTCQPKLEEAIINLTREHCAVDKPGEFPRHCRATRVGELFSATKTIQTRATELAARLHKPRIVRVIAFEPGSYRSYAFDALTGCRTWLDLKADWDADGEEMAKDEIAKAEVKDMYSDDSEDGTPSYLTS